MPSGVCFTNYSTIRYTNLEVSFYSACCFDFFYEISRKYVRMFLHPIGVSLAESFSLMVEIMM